MPVVLDLTAFGEALLNSTLENSPLKFWRQGQIKAGNAFALSNQASHVYQSGFYQNSPANGDDVELSFTLPAGSYLLRLMGVRLTSGGIQTVTLSNPDTQGSPLVIGTIDWYLATSTYASTFDTDVFTVTKPTRKLFRFVVTGKNASSSGHRIELVFVQAIPQ